MLIIDGNKTDININNFSNLEEVLVYASGDSLLQNRIVTDVLLNEKAFSELYPHQAEDIPTKDITSLKIYSLPLIEMAYNITEELIKVTHIIISGSKETSSLLRKGEDEEAFEIFQNLLDVTRDFMTMISVLRTDFIVTDDKDFINSSQKMSILLSEMTLALENEDWIMLADTIEYELIPTTKEWSILIESIRKELSKEIGKQ